MACLVVWQKTCVKPPECKCGYDSNGQLLHASSWHVTVCKCDAAQQHQWMLREIERQAASRETVEVDGQRVEVLAAQAAV